MLLGDEHVLSDGKTFNLKTEREAVARMFEATVQRSTHLANLPIDNGAAWDDLTRHWQKK
ncbi:MAG: hypothetical protein EXS30_08500 [Pedosphaera sp.]|nr:hypothetical protein [Pedosphaera sp.]